MISVEQAYDVLLEKARLYGTPKVERIPLQQASGRILAEPICAKIAVPAADNSAMDGYAFRLKDLTNFPGTLPVSQRIAAGEVPHPLTPGTAARIFTGALIPEGADTVIMQEWTQADHDNGSVTFNQAVGLGNAVRKAGSDLALGQTVLEQGECLGVGALGLLASLGIPDCLVYRAVRVATLLTGSELVEPGQPLAPGKIYNSNATLLQQALLNFPVQHQDFGLVADRLDATCEALQAAAESADLIITTGGVSVGEEDHVKKALETVGTLETWKIAIKPGKPFALGSIRRKDGSQALFVGLPGNPVSALVTFCILVRPFLLKLAGRANVLPQPILMRADFDWNKPDKRREFLRVRLNEEGGLSLYANQQSSILSSIHWADGLVENPPEVPIRFGDFVPFYSWSTLSIS